MRLIQTRITDVEEKIYNLLLIITTPHEKKNRDVPNVE